MAKRLLIATLGPLAAICMALTLLPTAPAQAEEVGVPPIWTSNKHKLETAHTQVTIWGTLKLNSNAEGEIECNNVMSAALWNEGTPNRGHGAIEGWGTNACKAPTLEEAVTKTYGSLCGIKIKCPITVMATNELPLEEEKIEAEVCENESERELSECKNKSERKRENVYHRLRRRPESMPWNLELVRELRNEEEVAVAKIGVPPAGQTCYPTEKIGEREVAVKWEKVPAGCIRLNVVAPQVPVEVVFYGSLSPQIGNGAGNGLNFSRLKFNEASGELLNKEAPETKSSGSLPIMGSEGEQLILAQ